MTKIYLKLLAKKNCFKTFLYFKIPIILFKKRFKIHIFSSLQNTIHSLVLFW